MGRAITTELKKALQFVSVRVLDHIIVAGSQSVSFAERGWSSPQPPLRTEIS